MNAASAVRAGTRSVRETDRTPSQAEKSRPRAKLSAGGASAIIADAQIGPTPGDRHQPGCDIVPARSFPDLPVQRIDPELEPGNLVHQHARKVDNFGRQIAVCAFYHRNEPTQMRNSCRGDDAVFGQMAA